MRDIFRTEGRICIIFFHGLLVCLQELYIILKIKIKKGAYPLPLALKRKFYLRNNSQFLPDCSRIPFRLDSYCHTLQLHCMSLEDSSSLDSKLEYLLPYCSRRGKPMATQEFSRSSDKDTHIKNPPPCFPLFGLQFPSVHKLGKTWCRFGKPHWLSVRCSARSASLR